MVFSYLDIFDANKEEVQEMKAHYQRGGLGDVKVKRRLADVLNALLDPIRAQRAVWAKDSHAVMQILLEGTAQTQEVAAQTMHEVRQAIRLDYK